MPRTGRSRREGCSLDREAGGTLADVGASEVFDNDGGKVTLDCIAKVCDAVAKLSEKVDALLTERTLVGRASREIHPQLLDRSVPPVEEEELVKANPEVVASSQIDTSWFMANAAPSAALTPPPNPWLQRLAPAATINVFDGDPREWPRFIASFKSMVHDAVSSDADRLAILSQLLSPRLREGFAGLLHSPSMYARVLQDLHVLYGNEFAMVKSHADSLCRVQPLRSESLHELERFYLQVHGPVSVLESSGWQSELNSVVLVGQISDKLTAHLKDQWSGVVQSNLPKTPNLRQFVDWVRDLIVRRRLTLTKPEQMTSGGSTTVKNRETVRIPRKTSAVFAAAAPKMHQCYVCEAEGHEIGSCPEFAMKNLESRLLTVRRLRLCLVCLERGHFKRNCKSVKPCTVEACGGRHHSLLHGAPQLSTKHSAESDHGVERNAGLLETTVNRARLAPQVKRPQTACAVVPLRVTYKGVSKQTFALLDSGADVSLMTRQLGDELRIPEANRYLVIRTIHGISRVKASETTCSVSSLDGSYSFVVEPMIVLERLYLAGGVSQLKRLQERWDHLRELPLVDRPDGAVQMLLGINVPAAHRHYDVRELKPGVKGPVGIRTPFGWTIVGHVPDAEGCLDFARTYFVGNRHCCSGPSEETILKQQLEKFWHIESYGTEVAERKRNKEETVADTLLHSTTRFVGGRYEVGLLWKSPMLPLPDNRDAALRRFFANERRVVKNSVIAKAYESCMEKLVALGQARKLRPSELKGPAGRTWYLSHHAVVSGKRPRKIRVVFDASARYQGVSLNDCLMKGPDLLVDLPGLLLKFRRRKVPLSADIESMYHQVRVPETDRSVLRFFWRKPGSDEPPRVHEMCVHVFGVTSSPCSCMHALCQAAEDHKALYPLAARKILENMYVDNLLDSVDTVEEAKTLYQEVTALLKVSGFRLRKWASSSRELLSIIPASERADPSVNLVRDRLPEERTLGISWDCEFDELRFHWTPPASDVVTKRSMLSVAARIFDPLGLISPIIVKARTILQDAWKLHCGWDDSPDERIVTRWKAWLSDLNGLSAIVIPRCVCPLDGALSLHVFSDASKMAYGAAVYLRVEVEGTMPHVSLVMARSKVAPLREITIPRLELQAAVMAVRLARSVTTELEMSMSNVTFWTDSSVVLYWLRGSSRRFSQYVESRVSEITGSSCAEQWRFVSGKDNPADDLSRGISVKLLNDRHRWFRGPEFLRHHESTWPKLSMFSDDISEADLEERATVRNVQVPRSSDDDAILSTIFRMSDMSRLLRVIRCVLRFVNSCRRLPDECSTRTAPTGTLESAWKLCIRKVQEDYFQKEIALLKSKSALPQRSKLHSLNPFLDESGIMHVNGRLRYGYISEEMKHPPILPAKHHFTVVLIRHAHEARLHSGTEDTLAELRCRAWVIDGRAAVRRVLSNCVVCRKNEGRPVTPVMAPLPRCRIEKPAHAFATIGIDYFGPFMVTERRALVKRWICLFTCLTVRAVHMEVCGSLDADAFLCAFRRFVARRGTPAICISDNGTNFVAGQRELNQGLHRLNSSRIVEYMNQKGIEWRFNPPGAPHFGGVWERLVRSAKRAMNVTLRGQRLTDEMLQTIVVEVEGLLNGRPLTHVSLHPQDSEPLTPNHFLLGRPYATIPPDVFHPTEVSSRRCWRAAQTIVDHFWRRWLREYLPTLNKAPGKRLKRSDVQVGDVVLVIDTSNPRGTWPVGRVEKVYPGPDGVVRVVDVKTKFGTKRRPVTRLVRLFQEGESP